MNAFTVQVTTSMLMFEAYSYIHMHIRMTPHIISFAERRGYPIMGLLSKIKLPTPVTIAVAE